MRADVSSSSPIVLPEETLHLGHHGAWLARLREITVASYFHRFLPVRRQRMRGQRNDWNLPRLRIVLQHLRRLPSIDDRNRDIHENEIGLLRSRLRDALLAIQRLCHRVAEMPQDRGIDDAVVLVVFDQQYCLAVRGHESPHTPGPDQRDGVVGTARRRGKLIPCSQVSYHATRSYARCPMLGRIPARAGRPSSALRKRGSWSASSRSRQGV